MSIRERLRNFFTGPVMGQQIKGEGPSLGQKLHGMIGYLFAGLYTVETGDSEVRLLEETVGNTVKLTIVDTGLGRVFTGSVSRDSRKNLLGDLESSPLARMSASEQSALLAKLDSRAGFKRRVVTRNSTLEVAYQLPAGTLTKEISTVYDLAKGVATTTAKIDTEAHPKLHMKEAVVYTRHGAVRDLKYVVKYIPAKTPIAELSAVEKAEIQRLADTANKPGLSNLARRTLS